MSDRGYHSNGYADNVPFALGPQKLGRQVVVVGLVGGALAREVELVELCLDVAFASRELLVQLRHVLDKLNVRVLCRDRRLLRRSIGQVGQRRQRRQQRQRRLCLHRQCFGLAVLAVLAVGCRCRVQRLRGCVAHVDSLVVLGFVVAVDLERNGVILGLVGHACRCGKLRQLDRRRSRQHMSSMGCATSRLSEYLIGSACKNRTSHARPLECKPVVVLLLFEAGSAV